jgi:hypothetical protein
MECGTKHRVTRSDARYCPSCRLTRQLAASIARVKRSIKCRGCQALFRPAFIRDKAFCGACEDARNSTGVDRLTWTRECFLCAGPVHPDIPERVCRKCLKDPERYGKDKPTKDPWTEEWSTAGPRRQERVLAALRKAQTKRAAANRATLTAIAAGQPHIHRITESKDPA